MKFIFETEDVQEALMYNSAPQFYSALYEIKELLRKQEKYGYTLGYTVGYTLSEETSVSSDQIVSVLKQKIDQIIYEKAPSFHEII